MWFIRHWWFIRHQAWVPPEHSDIFVHISDYSNLFCLCLKTKTCGQSSDVTRDGPAYRPSWRFISPHEDCRQVLKIKEEQIWILCHHVLNPITGLKHVNQGFVFFPILNRSNYYNYLNTSSNQIEMDMLAALNSWASLLLSLTDITRQCQKLPEQSESDIGRVVWKAQNKGRCLRTSRAVWARKNLAILSATVTDSAQNKSAWGFDKESLWISELCLVHQQ